MARGNQRDKAREKNQKEAAGQVRTNRTNERTPNSHPSKTFSCSHPSRPLHNIKPYPSRELPALSPFPPALPLTPTINMNLY